MIALAPMTSTWDPWSYQQTGTIIYTTVSTADPYLNLSWSSGTSISIVIQEFVDEATALRERRRLRSVAARLDATRVARRHPRRVVVRPRQGQRFSKRTCSLSSRWMVSQ